MTAADRSAGSSPVAHLVELVRQTTPPMHPAGRPFVLAGVLATVLLRRLWRPLGLPMGLLTAWCVQSSVRLLQAATFARMWRNDRWRGIDV